MGIQASEFVQIDPNITFNGTRIKNPDGPEIYLVDEGRRRHISSPDTYNALFENWDGIVSGQGAQALMQLIPEGYELRDAALVKGYNLPEVYLIDGLGK